MKKIILLLVIIQCTAAFPQQKKWTATKRDSIAITADALVGIDGYDAIYYIQNNVFFKLKDSITRQYQNLSLGKIKKVDLQNPLNIVLFYESFNTVVMLDNQLNEIRKISLSTKETPIVATAVGLAFGNRLWVYNNLTQQIGLFDYTKSSYVTITSPFAGVIKQYESNYNVFQWVDDKHDWYSCSINGAVTSLGKIPDYDRLQFISETELIYQKDGDLFYRNASGIQTPLLTIGKKTLTSFYYKDKILAIFTPPRITNYQIQIP